VLAQRALGALRLTRSFLLLEDDYDVDWEVDWSEQARSIHPHRVALRERVFGGSRHRRRPGQPLPAPNPCSSPIGGRSPAGAFGDRARRKMAAMGRLRATRSR
jgi:hypothetical protein